MTAQSRSPFLLALTRVNIPLMRVVIESPENPENPEAKDEVIEPDELQHEATFQHQPAFHLVQQLLDDGTCLTIIAVIGRDKIDAPRELQPYLLSRRDAEKFVIHFYPDFGKAKA